MSNDQREDLYEAGMLPNLERHQKGLASFLNTPTPDLALEVAALRQEIALLRAELKPIPSLILTGQQVAAEFKRLAGK